ncbi:MAG: hypothetical protein RL701_8174 [Pseudomonadota bacterium]
MQGFMAALEEQRWDDHRYYHHSRINQSLHVVSALCFLTSYALIFTSPTWAALVGWVLAMVVRQVGHFFFEPKGYDEVNQATYQHKEAIKVGYNLRRKQILLGIWVLTPLLLVASPSLFGFFEPTAGASNFLHRLSVMWLWLGAFALMFRTVQLFFVRDLQTGLVWITKILTDPFHDIKIYHSAPFAVLRGELVEPHAAGAVAHGTFQNSR